MERSIHARGRLALPAALAAVTLQLPSWTGAARADEMLRGPPPFLAENAFAAHGAAAQGYDGWLGGPKLLLDYGYRIEGTRWLDLQVNLQRSSCGRTGSAISCDPYRAAAAELVPGFEWRLRLDIPLVPYAKAGAGLVFVFPEAYRDAVGVAARGGGGLEYFLFDWLGVGVEADLSLGHVFRNEFYMGSSGYASLDFGLGAEVQF